MGLFCGSPKAELYTLHMHRYTYLHTNIYQIFMKSPRTLNPKPCTYTHLDVYTPSISLQYPHCIEKPPAVGAQNTNSVLVANTNSNIISSNINSSNVNHSNENHILIFLLLVVVVVVVGSSGKENEEMREELGANLEQLRLRDLGVRDLGFRV